MCPSFNGIGVPMANEEKRTVAEMIGELLRDGAILVAVFAPLDNLVNNRPLTFGSISIIVGLVLILAATGIAIEVKR